MFEGLEGHNTLVPWMWTSVILAFTAIILLINPNTRKQEKFLAVACVAVFLSIWIDKGLGMVVTAFIPSPLGKVVEYWPTLPEFMITLGIYGIGVLMVTVFYKVALSVRGEIA